MQENKPEPLIWLTLMLLDLFYFSLLTDNAFYGHDCIGLAQILVSHVYNIRWKTAFYPAGFIISFA